MREGKFYLVDWIYDEVKGVHQLSLQNKDDIIITSDSLEYAKDELRTRICLWNGDGEALIELLPQGKYGASFSMIKPSDDYWLENYTKELFEGGICSGCKFPIGKRTDICLSSSSKPKEGACYFSNCIPLIHFYSESLLKQIQELSERKFEVKPVLHKGYECGYFEILDEPISKYKLPVEYDLNTDLRTTFECSICGRKSYDALLDAKVGNVYLPLEDVFGKQVSVVKPKSLVMSGIVVKEALLKKLNRKGKQNKFLTSVVNVISNDRLHVPTDKLPIVTEIDWE